MWAGSTIPERSAPAFCVARAAFGSCWSPVVWAWAVNVPTVPRQSQGLSALADAQMQLLITLLNPDASVCFRCYNDWIKSLFLCLWQIKVIFLLASRLKVVLCCFPERVPVFIRNSVYNSNKKCNKGTCSMPYIKDLYTFYFILGEQCLLESSSEIDCALMPCCHCM